MVDLPIIWAVTDRVIERRLGPWSAAAAADAPATAGALTAVERKGLGAALLAGLAVTAVWVALVVGPGTPLLDEAAAPEDHLSPLYKSLVAGFLLLFPAAGWAYGAVTGSARGHRQVVRMMSASMSELGYYLVLAFAAAHFVAMFRWSNLGLILAVEGAGALRATGLPTPALLGGIVLLTGFVNLFVGGDEAGRGRTRCVDRRWRHGAALRTNLNVSMRSRREGGGRSAR